MSDTSFFAALRAQAEGRSSVVDVGSQSWLQPPFRRPWSLYIFPLICFIGCATFSFRLKSVNISLC